MEIFARVVETGSFTRAARRLNMSTSNVSRSVSELEHSLGVQLLNRTTRSVSATETGRAFYAHCAHIVVEAAEAEVMTSAMQSVPRGTLKVNVPVSFGVLHIAPVLHQLLGAYPDLCVDMTYADRCPNLVDEAYDVSVVIAAEPHATRVARELTAIRYTLCAALSYLHRRGMPATLDDLADHDCILFSGKDAETRWSFELAGEPWSIEVNGPLRLDNENAIRGAALAGCGVALLPTYMVGDDLQRDSLRAVLPQCQPPATGLYATYLSNRHVAPKVRVFVDFLVAQFSPRRHARPQ